MPSIEPLVCWLLEHADDDALMSHSDTDTDDSYVNLNDDAFSDTSSVSDLSDGELFAPTATQVSACTHRTPTSYHALFSSLSTYCVLKKVL